MEHKVGATMVELVQEKNHLKREIKQNIALAKELKYGTIAKKEILTNYIEKLKLAEHELESRKKQNAQQKEVLSVQQTKKEDTGACDQKEADVREELEREYDKIIKEKLAKLIAHKRKILAKNNPDLFANADLDNREQHEKLYTTAVLIIFVVTPSVRKHFRMIQPKDKNETKYYMQTFKISKGTKLEELKRVASEFWGVHTEEMEFVMEGKGSLLSVGNVEVDKYFHSTASAQRHQSVLFFQMQKDTTPMLTISEVLNAERANSQKHINQNSLSKNNVDLANEKLVAEFIGLKSIYNQDGKIIEVRDDLRKMETHVCSFFICAIILILTSLFIVYRRDTMSGFWLQESKQMAIKQPYTLTETQSDGSQIIIEFNYDKLSKFRQLYLFMQSTIPALLHLPVPNEKVHQAPLPNTMDINIGPLRIRQLRTKQKDCETDIPFINCYHMIYDDETAEKGDMNSSESWAKYTSASTNKIDYKTKGGLSDYDGGGYVLDLYTHNTTVEYIKLLFQKLLQAQFLGESTRAIIISHTSYSPSIDMFMDTVILFEFAASQMVIPSKLTTESYKVNMIELASEKAFFALDIFRLFFSLYFLYMAVMVFIKNRSISKRFTLNLFFSLVSNVSIPALILTNVVLIQMLSDQTTQYYIDNKDTYISMRDKTILFNAIFIIESVIFSFVTYKLLVVFRLNFYIHTIFSAVEKASGIVGWFLVIIIPIIMCFALIAQNIWGPAIQGYTRYSEALLSTLFMCVGACDIELLLSYNRTWATIYIIVFFFAIIYFLLMLFIGIFTESFRLTMLQLGYDSRRNKWTYQEYILWFCGFCPDRLLRRWKKNYREDEDDEEEEKRINQ